jgi:hypothetical protein
MTSLNSHSKIIKKSKTIGVDLLLDVCYQYLKEPLQYKTPQIEYSQYTLKSLSEPLSSKLPPIPKTKNDVNVLEEGEKIQVILDNRKTRFGNLQGVMTTDKHNKDRFLWIHRKKETYGDSSFEIEDIKHHQPSHNGIIYVKYHGFKGYERTHRTYFNRNLSYFLWMMVKYANECFKEIDGLSEDKKQTNITLLKKWVKECEKYHPKWTRSYPELAEHICFLMFVF